MDNLFLSAFFILFSPRTTHFSFQLLVHAPTPGHFISNAQSFGFQLNLYSIWPHSGWAETPMSFICARTLMSSFSSQPYRRGSLIVFSVLPAYVTPRPPLGTCNKSSHRLFSHLPPPTYIHTAYQYFFTLNSSFSSNLCLLTQQNSFFACFPLSCSEVVTCFQAENYCDCRVTMCVSLLTELGLKTGASYILSSFMMVLCGREILKLTDFYF